MSLSYGHAATVRRRAARAPRAGIAALVALLALVSTLATTPAEATPSTPSWAITSARAPTNFTPGSSSGEDSYLLTITNIGGAPSNGTPITITDELPAGLTPHGKSVLTEGFPLACSVGAAQVLCTGSPVIPPGGVVTVPIAVDVGAGAPAQVTNSASVNGGGATFASTSEPTSVSASPSGFALQAFDGSATNPDGSTDAQAGSHPYAMTTRIEFTSTTGNEGLVKPAASPKSIEVALPPGLVGDPRAVSQCTFQQLKAGIREPSQGCPISSQVGVVTLRETTALVPNTDEGTFPVYNMVPPPDRPAELAFQVSEVPVAIDIGVRTGSDYGLTAQLRSLSAALPVLGSSLTVWGDPADPSHDAQRCPLISLTEGICNGGETAREPHAAGIPPAPFLTLAGSCTGPQTTTIEANSWQAPGSFASASFLSHDSFGTPLGEEGCNQLEFAPSLAVVPDTSAAASPSGVDVELSVPQNANPTGLAEANLRTAEVRLPPGLTVNPSSADGLAACSPAQIALSDASPVGCPQASKIGSVEVTTPLLPDRLLGSIYVAQQGANPFGTVLAIYLTAEGDGVLVKLAGKVQADKSSGQLTTTFSDNPQLPFEHLRIHFFGGPRAPLSTPASCGDYATATSLTPWSGNPAVAPFASFSIRSGPGGSACAAPLPFAPSLLAGTSSIQAGSTTSFDTTFSREDGNQNLRGIVVHLPPGLLGKLAVVTPCGEPQAAAGLCGPASLLGHTEVSAGLGSDPFTVAGGQVFLTGPYGGAPFGLSITVPAKAGPFDLENTPENHPPCDCVVVRARLEVDPHSSAVTVSSDPLPTILEGIPLQVKRVQVTVDRPGFMLNPTSCDPMAIGATFTGDGGAGAATSVPFRVANCATLPFRPTFTASTQGTTSKANGASLRVKVTSGPGQANIGKVRVLLPLQLPSRLTTLQKACLAATFEADPARCPAASVVGAATARTPVLSHPLSGPAYLVSHGNAAFPDLEIVLMGEGIRLILDGKTDIKKGITSSTFESLPDAPVSAFELNLPEGPHSALATNLPAKSRRNLCGQTLKMPTQITGQNAAVIKRTTKVAVTGCLKAKKKRRAKHRRVAKRSVRQRPARHG